jgi:hypothetical protein
MGHHFGGQDPVPVMTGSERGIVVDLRALCLRIGAPK